jgi:peptidyl-prolyl cis-trans isomerase C
MPPETLRRTWLLGASLAASLVVLSACGERGAKDPAPQPGDKAVATVDGKTVWASDVKREAQAQGLIGEGEPLDVSSDLFRKTMDQVVDQKLLAAEAVKLKLAEDVEVQRRIAAARERILADAVVQHVVSDAVSENAVRGLYAEQQKLAKQSEEIRARQIVLANQADADAVKKLLASGASFEALAMERSIDAATRFNGGDLGYFTTDVMPEAYDAALQPAKPGEVVGPVQVEGGWALLKVEDRRPEKPITLDAARPQIVRFLTYDQIRDLLEKLRGRAKIQSLLPAPPAGSTAPKEPATAPAANTTADAAPADKTKQPSPNGPRP